jgi:hypothetical protein
VADITNNSRDPVYLREQDVQLLFAVFAVEVETTASSTDGWFPTEGHTPPGQQHMISLKSGETYRVFFPLAPQPQGYAAFQRWFQFIRFIPGAYPITVEAKYWDQNKFAGGDYHTTVEAKTVEYSAPQSIILARSSTSNRRATALGIP